MFLISVLKKIKNTARNKVDNVVLSVLERHLVRQKTANNFLQKSIISLVRKDDEMKLFKENGAKYFDNRKDFRKFCISFVGKNKKTDMWLEFGVYKGDSLRFFADHAQSLPVIGFDSFKGLPEEIEGNLRKGNFKLDTVPVFHEENIQLQIGYFQDTLPKFLEEHRDKHFPLIHIDSDLYSSAKFCLDELMRHNAISSGQIILFDDWYGYVGFEEGEYKAWHEFSRAHNIKYTWIAYTEAQAALRIEGI